VDRQTVEDFERNLIQNLKQLSEQLRAGPFQPQPVRRKWIDKLGSKEKRALGIPTVRDRVVQAALRMVLEPIFERDFAEQSYGFRPNPRCENALRRVDHLLKQRYTWIVDADLKTYFDTIPQDRLIERVEEKVSDGRMIGLVEQYLQQQVRARAGRRTPERLRVLC
jgi:RNA-directed DNA polymerase